MPSSWNMRHSGAGPPHSLNQASTSSVLVTIFLTWLLLRLTMSEGFLLLRISTRPPGRSGYSWANGNVSESNLLAKQVIGRLAPRVLMHRSQISVEHARNAVERPNTSSSGPPHTRELAACKTLATSSWKRPRRVIARSAKNIKREKVPHKLSRGRDASREPLRRMRPVGVVPPAVRVPAEAVALRLN